MLTDERLAEMLEIARRDDWHLKLVGSDIRMLISELTAAREAIDEIDDWTRWQKGCPARHAVGEIIPSRSGAAQVIEDYRAALAGKGE